MVVVVVMVMMFRMKFVLKVPVGSNREAFVFDRSNRVSQVHKLVCVNDQSQLLFIGWL